MTESADNRVKRADRLFEKAMAAHRDGRLDEAIQGYGEAIEINPESSRAFNNMGVALRARGAFHAAVASYRRAIAIKSDDAGSHSNLGNALRALGRHDEAEASHRQALALDADYLEARYNLGLVLKDQGKFDEGIQCLVEAVRRKADYVDAHWDLALAWLMMGDLKQGFEEYEWRWRLAENPPRRFDKPAWSGGALDGRTILLHAEQGMGDSIQFARYAAMVAARGGRVILECQAPLTALFESLDGVEQIIARDDPLPAFDVHAPLLSLPRIFKTDLDSIPASEAYLGADAARGKKFARLLDDERLNVGIVWAGKPSHRNDRNRSAGIEPFIDLLGTPGAAFHSLQVGPRASDIGATRCAGLIRDHAPRLRDFADTAALVAALDLVISVDTSVCHLAGALGKPCWVVIPYTPDWRWLMGREDSPWYPSLRLFRQPSFGDWPGVFDRLGEALEERIAA
ncbi:MAG: tetratricopeptide repeat protein [Alphaproteobacteria bacterium]|jgi:tetratricopeptide (TPR) repeat protein|nr:tetratricopeptide repeat protein [Alphaproteobacteria bacterium]MDP6817401.1 tetratricopeptide repeat protein [Alphaproteobacteria bacterium]|tara:strand:- start:533 stop:1903 length:1371 start_codon:yes stop_codon:yes gene_type:complete